MEEKRINAEELSDMYIIKERDQSVLLKEETSTSSTKKETIRANITCSRADNHGNSATTNEV